MPCLTLKSGAIIMVDNVEACVQALGEAGRQELRRLLEKARPELRLANPYSVEGRAGDPETNNLPVVPPQEAR